MEVDELHDDLYVIVPKWERFQHYKDRDPLWIKVYTKLLQNADYQQLSLASRGLLQVIWLAYASSSFALRYRDVRALVGHNRGIGLQLLSLRNAGFIELSASRLLAPNKEIEVEKEVDPLTPAERGNEKPISRALGTNPRAVAKRDKAERHEVMVEEARRRSESWMGRTDRMHENLDRLEAEHGAIFTDQERTEIIDGVLSRESVPF